MLFVIGMVFLVVAIILIIYNKPSDKNIFEEIIDKSDPYVDNIVIKDKNIVQDKRKLDVPIMRPDKYDGDLECPPSLGKGGMKNERRCRAILEKIYGKDFPTVRPSWLKNPATKRNLEIDCYNHQLRIGLEYSPDSSHTTVGSFHKTKESLIYQIRKDQWKANQCKKLGITLITVPSWATADLKGYITRKLAEAGKLPKN
jgi:hypothetical protein